MGVTGAAGGARRLLIIVLLGVGLGVGLAAGRAWAQPACPNRLFPPFRTCDRAGTIVCTAGFGLYRFDFLTPAMSRACAPQMQAAMAAALLIGKLQNARGLEALSAQLKAAINRVIAGAPDPGADFWVIAYNGGTKDATADLQGLLGYYGAFVGPVKVAPANQWDDPQDGAFWQPDDVLIQKLTVMNDSGMQPSTMWRPVPVAVGAGKVVAVPVRFDRKPGSGDKPRAAGVYVIGLFAETALDHYAVDPADLLSVGVAPIAASPGWGPVRAKW